MIAVDAGSTDPGPYYLGSGASFTDRSAVRRDLALILTAARERGIPVLIGSAGGAGAAPHLAWAEGIVREIAAAHRLRFRLATIAADVETNLLLEALAGGDLLPLPAVPPATVEDITSCTFRVAQLGLPPLLRALELGADVILAGRCYDPAVFAAPAIRQGHDPALALHLGKILECAAIAATPGSGSDCLLGTLRRDHFDVEPTSPDRACTVESVAAHTLYEKADPYLLPGPGGTLDLRATTFEQVTARAVRVRGTRFEPEAAPTLKVEGAAPAGFRAIAVAGARDPAFIARIDDLVAVVRRRLAEDLPALATTRVQVRVYGRDAVLGELEPHPTAGHEVGLVIDAVGPTRLEARTACAYVRSALLHLGFPGRVATAGNLAFPFSPSDLDAGPVYRFALHHLLRGEAVATLGDVRIEGVA